MSTPGTSKKPSSSSGPPIVEKEVEFQEFYSEVNLVLNKLLIDSK